MIRKFKFAIALAIIILYSNFANAQQVASPSYSIPFSPGTTFSIAAATTASAATLISATFNGQNTLAQVMVTNTGSNTCFVAFGSSTISASASTSTPVPAGAVEIFTISQYTTYVSAITASSTTTCYFTVGQGL